MYHDILVICSLPQGNMRFELKRGKLLGFLVLTALFIAWSLFFTSKTTSSTFLFFNKFYIDWHVYSAIASNFVFFINSCVLLGINSISTGKSFS